MSAQAQWPKDLLRSAITYCRLGLTVIPLHSIKAGLCTCGESSCKSPGKHPRVDWRKYETRVPTESEVEAWWDQWPESNVGIVTGGVSGVFVIDADGPEGVASLGTLGLADVVTPTVDTGGGGRHLYFEDPSGAMRNSVGRLAPKIDGRGEGGYVVAPPSRHVSGGQYRWVVSPQDCSLAPVPESLVALMRSQAGPGYASPPPPQITEGKRRTWLLSLAGTMRHRGMSAEAIIAALREENATRCKPPLPDDEVKELAYDVANRYPPAADGVDAPEAKSAANRLVQLAQSRYLLSRSEEGQPVAIPLEGPRLARTLREGRDSLRAELAAPYNLKFGKVPSSSAVADAMLVLEGLCQQGEPVRLHLRHARVGDVIFLDLGRPDGHCVRIDAAGWQVEESAPVYFQRTVLTGPMPDPVPGDFCDLRTLVNATPEQWLLLAGWLVGASFPDIPHPVLALTGEQGSAKSTLVRLIVTLLDPDQAPLRTVPRDLHDWAVVAAGSTMVALDNLSSVPAWLSDAICRAVTGDGPCHQPDGDGPSQPVDDLCSSHGNPRGARCCRYDTGCERDETLVVPVDEQDVEREAPDDRVRVPHLVDDLVELLPVVLQALRALRDVQDVKRVLGVVFGQIGHRLHRDAEFAFGTAVEDGDVHGTNPFVISELHALDCPDRMIEPLQVRGLVAPAHVRSEMPERLVALKVEFRGCGVGHVGGETFVDSVVVVVHWRPSVSPAAPPASMLGIH